MGCEGQNAKTVNILHVFGKMSRGGAEMRTLELMQVLQHSGYRMAFCVLSGLPGELDNDVRSLGGQVYPVRLHMGFQRNFRNLLREHRFDVVHSHVHLASGYILRLAHMERVPKRIAHFRSTHDGHDETLIRRLRNRLLKALIDRNATHILGVCEGVMKTVWGDDWMADPRCHVIYNGITEVSVPNSIDRVGAFREFNIPLEGRLIIHVGRMAPPKNHLGLLDIFAAIQNRFPGVYLLLVGREDSAIAMKLREKIEILGIGDIVRFAGERRDVRRLLGAAELLLFPSLWEGLPGVVLEACASCTQVLASNLPGVEEIRRHFPGLVKSLDLQDGVMAWADMAVSMLKSGTRQSSESLRGDFRQSVFSISRHQQQMCNVWN